MEQLVLLDLTSEYSADQPGQLRALYHACKAIADRVKPKGAELLDFSYIKNQMAMGRQTLEAPTDDGMKLARLPEIPLPKYEGDFRYWTTFRDQFKALVDTRTELSDINKMYYLLGCLKGPAAEAVRGIPISATNYALVWSTLTNRFHRPRLVATSLIDKLLHAPSFSQESVQDLNNFVCSFTEDTSLLTTLQIPDLASFMLFSMAFRCLPLSTRKMFETQTPADYPTIDALLEFVRARASVLELAGDQRKPNISNPVSKSSHTFGQARKGGERTWKSDTRQTSLVVSKPTSSSHRPCLCCSGSHALASCTRFKEWAVDERSRWAREKRLCFVCFSADHWAPKCVSKARCQLCTGKHHQLLHPSSNNNRVNKDDTHPPEASLCASTSLQADHKASSVLLGTALVHMRDRSGSWQTMRALVDCASQISAVTSSCVERLGLKCVRWTAPVTGLSGVPVLDIQGRVECQVQPRYAEEPVLSVHAWVLPTITGELPHNTLPASVKDRFANFALADPSFNVTAPVDVLLGADVYPSIMNGRQVVVDAKLPVAFSSIFGWILIGPISVLDANPYRSLPVSLTVSIEGLMNRFWQVEEPTAAPETFTEDGQCECIFRDQSERLPSGRFSVPLPFRTSVPDGTFAGSRDVAVKRFESLERKLSADPQLKLMYVNFMSNYLASEHMSIASGPGCYYIPHHAVYKPEVDETKIRVVFDASARSYRGPSLNSCLLPGKKLQQDIVDILTRFRVWPHVFTADIRQMYRQILVLPPYRKYQHIFWRSSPHDALLEYELNTVTYGMNCAPFLALRVLQSIAMNDCSKHDAVRDALTAQMYVDDACVGADTVVEAVQLQSDLVSILGKAGLELRKWSSNTPAILETVPDDHRVSCPLPFDSKDDSGTKVLGLQWHPDEDVFRCALRLDAPVIYTKRGLLSLIAKIFDPLGLFAPTTFFAKCVMQRTWMVKMGWDDPLPIDIHRDWASFVDELPSLRDLKVPRYFNTLRGSSCYLLGFCDASQRGYAAVIYLKVLLPSSESVVYLVGAKTKLAPMQPLTIPRIELNAAVLLARWMNRINKILEGKLNIVQSHAWTDSAIVLSWVTSPHATFKVYVSNRVHQITSLLPDCKWSHVRSEDNPADCASRGVMPSSLATMDLYWHGPDFIHHEPASWPSESPTIPLEDLPEIRPLCLLAQDNNIEWYVRFSSYDRLVRVTARLYRFIRRCQNPHLTPYPPYLKSIELEEASHALVIASQHCHFPDLLHELSLGKRLSSKSMNKLHPFLDATGAIRVGGRLRHSALNYDAKHPVLLAKTSHLAQIICRRWHLATFHAGPRVVTALISRQYWIISIRSVLFKISRACVTCVRFDARAPRPLMADLPPERVHRSRPFSRVGVDYAGPLQMREVRLRKSRSYKVYIAIFVCFAVKAVHLEVVTELSTEAFLAAFDRFVARRGVPTDVFSDCGTNFVGADRQLHKLINSPEGQVTLAETRATCQWHFNPPSAPHFGGLWEAAVRSTKRLLVRTMGNHLFTYEEFVTLITRIEAVLNSRPLTPTTSDPSDLDYLSPGHFLIGQPLLAIPPKVEFDSKISLNNRWKLLDQCHQAFWRKWSSEYLTTLQARSKWTSEVPNININDMVIIIDGQHPPLLWTIGRVVELLPGSDNVVRVAKVLTRQGQFVRPVAKLIVLPTAADRLK